MIIPLFLILNIRGFGIMTDAHRFQDPRNAESVCSILQLIASLKQDARVADFFRKLVDGIESQDAEIYDMVFRDFGQRFIGVWVGTMRGHHHTVNPKSPSTEPVCFGKSLAPIGWPASFSFRKQVRHSIGGKDIPQAVCDHICSLIFDEMKKIADKEPFEPLGYIYSTEKPEILKAYVWVTRILTDVSFKKGERFYP